MPGRLTLTLILITLSIWAGCGPSSPSQPGMGESVEPPTDLTAEWASSTEILLKWRDRSLNEDGFEIFQSVDSTLHFAFVTSVPASTDSVVLGNKSQDTVYYFRVRAYKGQLRSGYSDVARVADRYLVKTLDAGEPPVLSIDWSPSGTQMLSGNGDHRIWIWDISSGAKRGDLQGHNRPVEWVNWSQSLVPPIVASGVDTDIRIWDIDARREIYYLTGIHPTFTRDGRYLVFENDETTIVAHARQGDIQRRIPGRFLGVTDDSNWLIVVVDELTQIQFWDLNDTLAQTPSRVHARAGAYRDIKAMSPQGKHYIKRNHTDDGDWAVVGIGSTGSQLKESFPEYNAWSFSPTDSMVAGSQVDEPWYIYVWDVYSGELIHLIQGHEYTVNSLDWSYDGTFLASGSGDQTIKIWGPFR